MSQAGIMQQGSHYNKNSPAPLTGWGHPQSPLTLTPWGRGISNFPFLPSTSCACTFTLFMLLSYNRRVKKAQLTAVNNSSFNQQNYSEVPRGCGYEDTACWSGVTFGEGARRLLLIVTMFISFDSVWVLTRLQAHQSESLSPHSNHFPEFWFKC